MSKNLTKRQKQILDFIVSYIKKYDYSPSFREIGNGVGLSSPATVHRHIEALRQKGFLKSDFN